MNEDKKQKILVVDDEQDIRELLTTTLEFNGFDVETAKDGNEAIKKVEDAGGVGEKYNLLILDIMMPQLGGIEALKRLRVSGDNTPALFLTAKDAVANKVEGLAVGADDYVTKPFDLQELVARVRAILRRTDSESSDLSSPFDITRKVLDIGNKELSADDLVLNLATHEATRGGQSITLGPTEYKILELLLINKGRIVSKEEILQEVWHQEWAESYAIIDTYLSNLRKKLNKGGKKELIKTKRSFGYMIP
ncbi:MAG: response regulator transcription factor [Candidatus Ancillula sp.]|jgi:two-component system OmpR family response regulator|nr:response regulator transcription factor [Candidatus Ancillula sp.]